MATRLVHMTGDEFLFDHSLIHEAIYESILKVADVNFTSAPRSGSSTAIPY